MDEQEKKNKKSISNSFLNSKNMILGVIAILTTWNTYISDKNKNNLEIESTRIDNTIKTQEFENNLKMEMYREVKASLYSDTIKRAATALILDEMLQNDSAFLWKLKSVLAQSSFLNNDQEAKAELDSFSTLEKSISGNQMTIDVFYLDDIIDESLPRAKKIVELLEGKGNFEKVRLRLLPASVNSRPGYRIGQNQIRHEKNESQVANNIRDLIVGEGIFPLEEPSLQLINSKTTNYISVFVRNM